MKKDHIFGTVKVKIKDDNGNTYWIAQSDNALELSTDELNAQGLSQTGDDSEFTLSYEDSAGGTWYVAKSGTDVIFATTKTSWEVSGEKLQVQGSTSEQLKLGSAGGLTLANPGHTVALHPIKRRD